MTKTPTIGVRKLRNMLDRDCTLIDGPDLNTEIATLKNGRGQTIQFKVNGWNRFIEKQQLED